MRCENCNQTLYGEKNFCSNCGQKNIPKISLKYLFNEVVDNVLNLDSKLFSTLKLLFFKPGFLSLEFKEGKRVKYVSPVRFYIIISLIFFFMVSIIRLIPDKETENNEELMNTTFSFEEKDVTVSKEQYKNLVLNDNLDSFIKDSLEIEDGVPHFFVKQTIKAQNSDGGFGDVLLNQLSFFLLLFIPLISLVYNWSFIKNKYTYIDHVVFNIHFNSFVITLLGINEFFKLIIGIFYNWSIAVGIIFISAITYLFIAIRKFYGRKKWVTSYKLIILLTGYLILALVFTVLLFLASIIAN